MPVLIIQLDSMNWSAVSLSPMISSLPIGTATTKGEDKDLVQPSDGKKENRTFHRDVLVFILGVHLSSSHVYGSALPHLSTVIF